MIEAVHDHVLNPKHRLPDFPKRHPHRPQLSKGHMPPLARQPLQARGEPPAHQPESTLHAWETSGTVAQLFALPIVLATALPDISAFRSILLNICCVQCRSLSLVLGLMIVSAWVLL